MILCQVLPIVSRVLFHVFMKGVTGESLSGKRLTT